MKVKVFVEQEVEAEISIGEMMAELGTISKPEAARELIDVITRLYAVLKHAPDSIIQELSSKQREVIVTGLRELADRVSVTACQPEAGENDQFDITKGGVRA
ncbi:hypothetical protein [Noviherbaspirillum sp.]|uniref:hypothetical protein n=1 Tax=Noviherbaspirillum sp. TaxID=1926288 RepID=UPI002D48C6B3|nr:hypothetical protein [Noviherbaspirillum sp.]HZW21769.1 hypothetical protein [Noviherbaspirillum sp.]